MARPRKPTADLALRGAFRKNPARLRERDGEPVVLGELGGPPDHLTDAAKSAWVELAAHASWLTPADAFLVELASVLMAEFRSGTGSSRWTALLVKTLNDLGFSPVARTRIKAPQPKVIEVNPFEQFL